MYPVYSVTYVPGSDPRRTSPLKGEAIFRSLPWGEGLKGGGFRVRLGFGKMTEN